MSNAERDIVAPVVAQVKELSISSHIEKEIVMCFGIVAGSDIVDRDVEIICDTVIYIVLAGVNSFRTRPCSICVIFVVGAVVFFLVKLKDTALCHVEKERIITTRSHHDQVWRACFRDLVLTSHHVAKLGR